MPPRETYRLTAPVILWWVWLAFVAANVVDWAAQGTSTRLAVHVGAIMLAVTGLVYALGLRPKVVADDAGLTVLNPFRDHRVPWAAVKDVDTADWVLVRTSGDRTIYCWALYVSARARRRANPPPRKSLAMAKLRGVAVDPGTGISSRLPDDAQYLASLPPAKAIAARLDARAQQARVRGDAARIASGEPTADAAAAADAADAAGASGSAGAAGAVTVSWARFPLAAVLAPAVAMLTVLLAT